MSSFYFFVFLSLIVQSLSLNNDGVLLLSLKYSILNDPLSVLESWNYDDATPCSWTGITCTEFSNSGSNTPEIFRVTSVVLPGAKLLGSIPTELGNITHLTHLDLSYNFFNGTLPDSILNAGELQVLSLSNNEISGELPESVAGMLSLRVLNLSDNALAGEIPKDLTKLKNLSVVSLRSNYFSGSVPSGSDSVQVLDLSSNLFNGSLPLDFGGKSLSYFNVSYNRISGSISPEFAEEIPENATVDISFNNLTGPIPESLALLNQKTESFSGNPELCGKPLKNLCSIPSTLSTPPNVSTSISPAIAVIPRPIESTPGTSSPGPPSNTQNQTTSRLKSGTIAAIAVADLAGIAVLAMIILYVYQLKKRRALRDDENNNTQKKTDYSVGKSVIESRSPLRTTTESPSPQAKTCSFSCLTIKDGEEPSSSEANSSDSDRENEQNSAVTISRASEAGNKHGGFLVTVDGETQLELETLLKASAYVLGASGSSIVYKAVLEDGTAFAVRRIGESCAVERFKDFENQVRAIAKLRHPNLVTVRGFYWGNNEKLLIYEYVVNGSLASSSHGRPAGSSSSPCNLSLEARLRIAKGVARGLAYIHEKKLVHGKIKPTNILLTYDMEPMIADLGLDRLVSTAATTKATTSSARNTGLGSQRSTSRLQDQPTAGSSLYAGAHLSASPYQAPESLKNLKPSPKWDVYSFGMVLLELLTGRVLSERELGQWTAGWVATEERNRVLRLADTAIRGEVGERGEEMVGWFKLGFSCTAFVAQKRPNMREAVQGIEKMSSRISNSYSLSSTSVC